jgi:cation diffusion facilitator CzcD-associated flavoprotein CzcO
MTPHDTIATHSPENQPNPLFETVGIIGSGIAGLITAHVLLQDGFKSVEVLTRDKSVGGVWSEERVYFGLRINRSVSSSQLFQFRASNVEFY